MKLPSKKTLAIVILIVLVSVLNGQAGARIIWGLAKNYFYKKKREKERLDRAFGYDTFRVALSRLKRDGLIEKSGWGNWRITIAGKKLVEKFLKREGKATKPQEPREKKGLNTVIIFDIPEAERKKRNYLRLELAALSFRPLQKSVWIGNGPLPEEFIDYLRQLRLLNYIHIFTIKDYGTII